MTFRGISDPCGFVFLWFASLCFSPSPFFNGTAVGEQHPYCGIRHTGDYPATVHPTRTRHQHSVWVSRARHVSSAMDAVMRQRVKGIGPVTHRCIVAKSAVRRNYITEVLHAITGYTKTLFFFLSKQCKNNIYHGFIRVEWIYCVLSAEQPHGKHCLRF